MSIRLYDDPISGNGFKVRLVLSQVGIDYDYRPVDLMKSETHTPEFLEINPNGKIPAVVLDDGRTLFESNAIMWYFARGTALVPQDTYLEAQVLQWMGFEQYSHEPKVAVARFIMLHTEEGDPRREEIPDCHDGGYRALNIMESHLTNADYFVDNRYSIADISLYAYTHVAEEGGFDMSRYPAINAWIDRVVSQPGYINITDHGSHA